MSGMSIPDILENGWSATRTFILVNPVRSVIYDVSLKFFGLYCQTYFYPLGVSLAVFLITSSIVFDFAIFGQINAFKTNFFRSFSSTKDKIVEDITKYRGQLGFSLLTNLERFFSVRDSQ